jgi:hypothetical protein
MGRRVEKAFLVFPDLLIFSPHQNCFPAIRERGNFIGENRNEPFRAEKTGF